MSENDIALLEGGTTITDSSKLLEKVLKKMDHLPTNMCREFVILAHTIYKDWNSWLTVYPKCCFVCTGTTTMDNDRKALKSIPKKKLKAYSILSDKKLIDILWADSDHLIFNPFKPFNKKGAWLSCYIADSDMDLYDYTNIDYIAAGVPVPLQYKYIFYCCNNYLFQNAKNKKVYECNKAVE